MTLPNIAPSLLNEVGISERTNFDFAAIARMLRAIDARLKPLQDQRADVDAAIGSIQTLALARINDALLPGLEAILRIQDRGFLIANSNSSRTLGDGFVLNFSIPDEDERATFTPSPFLAITRAATSDDFAIARRISYDKSNGQLSVEIMSVFGDPGPHSDWVIAAVAGATVGQQIMLDQGKAARDTTTASASQVAADRIAVAADKVTAVAAKDTAVTKAAEAAASAVIAATFNPASYYTKTQSDDALATKAATDHAHSDAAAGGASGFMSGADKTKLDGVSTGADVTGAAIHAATAKTTPVDADTIGLIDSAASNALKKLSWANVKATLKTYFDTLYVSLSGGGLTGGFRSVRYNYGTLTGGTITLNLANGNGGKINLGAGGGTIAAPAAPTDEAATMVVDIIGLAGATGTPVLSGFDDVSGDALPVANMKAVLMVVRTSEACFATIKRKP